MIFSELWLNVVLITKSTRCNKVLLQSQQQNTNIGGLVFLKHFVKCGPNHQIDFLDQHSIAKLTAKHNKRIPAFSPNFG
jgi:hypothetical protein